MSSLCALLLVSLFTLCSRGQRALAFNIDDFNSVASKDTTAAALQNVQAFTDALQSANSSSSDMRVVTVSQGKEYYMGMLVFENIHDVLLDIRGKVIFSDEIKRVWNAEDSLRNGSMIEFQNSVNITIRGGGTFDGQGLPWWRLAYTGNDVRPKMMRFRVSRDVTISDITLLNSPSFHLIMEDCRDVQIFDVTIFVDSGIHRIWGNSVMYPLNTDAIDLRVVNATVYNNKITAYDDGIVVKPCSNTGTYCTCAGDVEAYGNHLEFTTGLSIGSVSPSETIPCVKNVYFHDNYLWRPLKAIYVKPNPKREGDTGKAVIDTITYENIVIDQAVWWTVWLGPQQEHQPGGENYGCSFLYPFVPQCNTQPLVLMNNIRLINVTATDTLPLFEGPGVILCDESNPCTDFEFSNVINTIYPGNASDIIDNLPFKAPGVIFPTRHRTDDWEFQYITSNVYGVVDSLSEPSPCFNDPTCFNAP